MTTDTRHKRPWAYCLPPKAFEMAPCACGNHDTMWSEYVSHLWCPVCEIDFRPEHGGIFDGPVPTKLAAALGIRFDRIDLATQRIQRYNVNTLQYEDAETGLPVSD